MGRAVGTEPALRDPAEDLPEQDPCITQGIAEDEADLRDFGNSLAAPDISCLRRCQDRRQNKGADQQDKYDAASEKQEPVPRLGMP